MLLQHKDTYCLCVSANTAQSPYKKLQEALSSVEAFEKHYLVSMARVPPLPTEPLSLSWCGSSARPSELGELLL